MNNEKELSTLAKEHNVKIISFEPFLGVVAQKDEMYKVYENGVERVVRTVSDERTFTGECSFRDYCRDEVYAGVYRVVHNGWNL